jgi:uncharacterized protein
MSELEVPSTRLEVPPAGRDEIWDVLRGVGVLGIFMLHCLLFAYAYEEMYVKGLYSRVDWPFMLAGAVGNGKFITILAIVFGAGSAMIAGKVAATGGSPAGVLARRFVVLGGIGLAHYLLLFWGDILQFYCLAGLLSLLFVRRSDTALAIAAAVGVGLTLLCNTALTSVLAVGMMIHPEIGEDMGEWVGGEHAAFTAGSYGTEVAYRADTFLMNLGYMLFEVPFIAALMCLGMLAWRRRWLAAPKEHAGLLRKVIVIGLAVGVPVNLVTALATSPIWMMLAVYPQRYIGGPSVGLAFAALLALWVASGPAGLPRRLLRAVGERALSCYLLQSVLGGAVFYSWGLHWFDQRTPSFVFCVVLPVVWAVVIAVAWGLEKAGVRGPVEWLWRKLVPTR